MPRGVEPCPRRHCRGELHVQAWSPQADGVWTWLACDMDARHVEERVEIEDSAEQDALPGLDTA